LDSKLNTKYSALNYSQRSLTSVSSQFPAEWNFDMLRFSQIFDMLHTFKGFIISLYIVSSSCILTSRCDHVLSFLGI